MVNKSKKNRYYDSQGKLLPGSTTVLQVLAKNALIEWAFQCGLKGIDYKTIRDGSAGRGTACHDAIESILLSKELPDLSKFSSEDTQIIMKSVSNFKAWLDKQKGFKVIDVELVMSSDKLGFGGTLDLYCIHNGKKSIIDFKTSKAVYLEHYLQQASYKLLKEEQGDVVEKIKLLKVNETGCKLTTAKDNLIPLYTKYFLAALEVYKAKRALEIVEGKKISKGQFYKRKAIEKQERVKL